LEQKWFKFKTGKNFNVGYKFNLAYRSFKANKQFNKYLCRLDCLELQLLIIEYPDQCIHKIERSKTLFKIPALVEKLKILISDNESIKYTTMYIAKGYYYIASILANSIFSVIFHVFHIILNFSFKITNPMLGIGICSIIGYVLSAVTTFFR
jgi:hypothetical protein